MGRRALPKLKSDVAYEHLLGEVRDLVAPFEPARLFPRAGELEIEIGSGKGLFLLNASAAQPDRNFLGVEIAKKYARFAAYRLAQHGHTNAYVLAGYGLTLFRDLLPDHAAAAVHVYFPDPWWKERHRKRRVIQPGFVRDVARVLRPGGVFHFWTDVEEYYDSATQVIAAQPELSGPHPVEASPAEHDMDYRTHFERRMRRNDQPVFRCYFQRT
jgi:tRNA (guanine-N7-)-methyltransferase